MRAARRKRGRKPVPMLDFAPKSSKAIFGLILFPVLTGVGACVCFYAAPDLLTAICNLLLPLTQTVMSTLAMPQSLGADGIAYTLAEISLPRVTAISLNVLSFAATTLLTVITIVRYRKHVGEWVAYHASVPVDKALQPKTHVKLIGAGLVIIATADLFFGGVALRLWLFSLAGGVRSLPVFLAYMSAHFLLMNMLASATVQMLLYKLFSKGTEGRLHVESDSDNGKQ